jgi:hypothetical protein
VALFRDTNYAGFYHYFNGFGFAEAFRLPEDAEKYFGARSVVSPRFTKIYRA